MVLLNGVKYACERCIRGHRVSSCTHTDKPLTMIKPKGRPASQCLHCRESRKLKNTHSSCSCGKKGKSPGQHLASCLCHKNSHCTCPLKEKKDTRARSRVHDSSQSVDFTKREDLNDSTHRIKEDKDLLIEDVLIPFETDRGLLDFFQDSNKMPSTESQVNEVNASSQSIAPEEKHSSDAFEQLPNPPSDADLDLMENMFPLFPLVGANSFDNSKSLPLLPMPTVNNDFLSNSQEHSGSNNSASLQTDSRVEYQDLRSHTIGRTEASQHASTLGANHFSQMPHISTHNPLPLRASMPVVSSQNVASARPKRPESVLSLASTSSNTSKQNLLDGSGQPPQGISKLSSTAAFPPYHHVEVGSADELSKSYYDTSNIFSDGHLLSFASDQEDLHTVGRTFSMGATPQSSLPSRQPLQLRRKTSLSRSHSQLHHNHGLLNWDRTLMPLKTVTAREDLVSQEQSVEKVSESMMLNDPLMNEIWLSSAENGGLITASKNFGIKEKHQ